LLLPTAATGSSARPTTTTFGASVVVGATVVVGACVVGATEVVGTVLVVPGNDSTNGTVAAGVTEPSPCESCVHADMASDAIPKSADVARVGMERFIVWDSSDAAECITITHSSDRRR